MLLDKIAHRKTSISEDHLTRMPAARPQQAVIWSKTLRVDTCCETVTMTSMHAVDAPRCLPARGYRRLGSSVPDPMEDAGQREAAR